MEPTGYLALIEEAVSTNQITNIHTAVMAILAARYLHVLEQNPENLPDWLHALAGGSPENWEAVIDITRSEMEEVP